MNSKQMPANLPPSVNGQLPETMNKIKTEAQTPPMVDGNEMKNQQHPSYPAPAMHPMYAVPPQHSHPYPHDQYLPYVLTTRHNITHPHITGYVVFFLFI